MRPSKCYRLSENTFLDSFPQSIIAYVVHLTPTSASWLKRQTGIVASE